MNRNGITRREFLRGGAALLGLAAARVWGGEILPVPSASAADSETDTTSPAIVRDMSRCIGCGKCVEVCSERQGLDILTLADHNGRRVSSLKYAATLAESQCIGCGQCARHCPSGAIAPKDALTAVNQALTGTEYRYIVWQFAPSAQHIIGEEFRMLAGTDMSGKLAAAVKRLDPRNLAFSAMPKVA